MSENLITKHFSSIKDPRIERGKKHKLSDIFFMALCAAICGADNWVSVELFCKAKEAWFTKLLDLKNGIPSHDTFGNVFAMIDIDQFSECFAAWVRDLADLSKGEIVAIDGKCVRRSVDKASKKAAIHMVSAWACNSQCVLGQTPVAEKSNEIEAIPRLLKVLDLSGITVTIDAMGCQRDIAEQIVDQGGDYLFSLKGNQGTLHRDVQDWFESDITKSLHEHETVDGDHGRIETRTVLASSEIDWLQKDHKWPHLKTIVSITSKREIDDVISEETRYFISSLDAEDVEKIAQCIRAHWGVENRLHWTLDMAFDEDRSRVRMGNSAANLAILRHLALNLIKSETSLKTGVKNKRLNAGWDNDYMLKIISG